MAVNDVAVRFVEFLVRGIDVVRRLPAGIDFHLDLDLDLDGGGGGGGKGTGCGAPAHNPFDSAEDDVRSTTACDNGI